jgi:sugar/nucleoside kinase (ribokinase family)
VDSFVENLVDPIGAGDALLAYASLSLKASGNLVIASILGSIGAAVACEHSGNSSVSVSQVVEKIGRIEKQAHY